MHRLRLVFLYAMDAKPWHRSCSNSKTKITVMKVRLMSQRVLARLWME